MSGAAWRFLSCKCISSNLRDQLLKEQAQLKSEVAMLREENEKNQSQRSQVQQHLSDMKYQSETNDHRTQQQQVGTGSLLRHV